MCMQIRVLLFVFLIVDAFCKLAVFGVSKRLKKEEMLKLEFNDFHFKLSAVTDVIEEQAMVRIEKKRIILLNSEQDNFSVLKENVISILKISCYGELIPRFISLLHNSLDGSVSFE